MKIERGRIINDFIEPNKRIRYRYISAIMNGLMSNAKSYLLIL